MNDSAIPVLHPITRLIVGGAQENTMYLAALMPRDRFRSEIVAGPQTGSEGSLQDEIRDRGVPVTILSALGREIRPLSDLRAIWQLYRHIRRRGFTVVHTHSSKAGILGRVAARLAGTPVIVHTVHGWSFHDRLPRRRHRLYASLERWVASFTDALIVVAECDRHAGRREGIGRADQYRLIRSAIPLPEFDPGSIEASAVRAELGLALGAPVVGTVGRLSRQKNPLDWVRVVGRIARSRPDCRFLMVGDGPLRPRVEALLAAEGLAGKTVLTGLRRDVPRLLAAMDVFLLTSLWEGLPRAVAQAMAMQLPVVAFRAGGVPEAVRSGETGHLVEPGDVAGAARGCLDLLADASGRERMGRLARSRAAREFDLTAMVAATAGLYEEILARRRVTPTRGEPSR